MRPSNPVIRERLRPENLVDGRPVKPCRRCNEPGSVFADVQGARLCAACSRSSRPAPKKLTAEAAAGGHSLLEHLLVMERTHEPMNCEQIAAALGMTRNSVYRIEATALRKFEREWKRLYGTPEN